MENFDKALQNGWIKVYYQGISRVETRKYAAFEALARWVDPVRGIIPPNDFYPSPEPVSSASPD
ncbi:MAG: EAL domain-containing protein [Clostridia bacterium]|nr:EAL domain-containing protein [Clostridia bacterium]